MIDDSQNPMGPSVTPGIMDKIHPSTLSLTTGRLSGPAMQRPVFPSTHAHPQLEPIQITPSPHPSPIDHPAFAPDQHPDSR